MPTEQRHQADPSGPALNGEFDPLAPEVVADLHGTYARLRAQCPVARGSRWANWWALTKYEDVVAASTDPSTFSSSAGIVIPPNPVSGRRAPMHYDPPEHTVYRRALNQPFREERVADLEPEFRSIASELLAGLIDRGSGDAVAEFASPYAAQALVSFLHIPESDRAETIRQIEAFEEGARRRDREKSQAASEALYELARHLVALRRQVPLDPDADVVTGLCRASDGSLIDDAAIVGIVRQIHIAGHVALVAALGSAILHLAQDGQLQETVRAQPELIPSAIEELLRLHTPNQGFARTVTRAVEVRGRSIPVGDRVALVYTSANRDGDVFTRPDDFVLDRDAGLHLAFGHGVHKCPGAALARLELRIALRELLARTGSFAQDGEPTFVGWPLHGAGSLPLRLVPSS